MSKVSTQQELLRHSCAELPEYLAFTGQSWRKQKLIEETGGGERFVEQAVPLLRKHVLQTLRYGSTSSQFIHRLRNAGASDDALARALARAWLAGQDYFELPRARTRDMFRGTPALALYSVLIMIAVLVSSIGYLRHARPHWAETMLAFPPLLALLGAAGAIPIFALLRAIVPRGRASRDPTP